MSIRHVIHDNERCRLVVEVDVGMVTLSLFFGTMPDRALAPALRALREPGGFSSHASVHLSPSDARDRIRLSKALSGLEEIAGQDPLRREDGVVHSERRVPLDALHRSIMDITRRPTA